MKNKIEDLRNHLFATIEGLLDKDEPLDVDKAKAVAQVASVIIESGKLEVKYLETIESNKGSKFLESGSEMKQLG